MRHNLGGLLGQPDYAYLRAEWLDTMTADPATFRCTGYETGKTPPRFAWAPVRVVVLIKQVSPHNQVAQIMLINTGLGTLFAAPGATPVSILPLIMIAKSIDRASRPTTSRPSAGCRSG